MSIIPGFSARRSNVFDPLSLDLWDPFDRCPFLKDVVSAAAPSEASRPMGAPVDWKETPEAHVIKADLPGMKKEEVKVEVEEGRVLQISGERRREEGKEGKDVTWHRMERSSGRFARRFRLPEDARVDGVKAEMVDGVLTVTVPKAEAEKPAVKCIDISG